MGVKKTLINRIEMSADDELVTLAKSIDRMKISLNKTD